MLNNRRQISHHTPTIISTLDIESTTDFQHGPFCYFPDNLPQEGVSRISCYLDPPSLLLLGTVCKVLSHHVSQEDTWRRAFGVWYLGLGPESEFKEGGMIRRGNRSWRKEFIHRWDFVRRWELTRAQTIVHTPLHTHISSIYLLPLGNTPTLLSSSLSLGVVSRSLPLTGKIIRGFLDASGTGNGLGIGNPNAEFSPNISCCQITNDGGTVKIVWGWRTGEVCVLTAPSATNVGPRQVAATVVRSKVDQDHAGTVLDVVFGDDKGNLVVSGANDGLAKVWNTRDKKVRCVWTSTWRPCAVAPDPVCKLASKDGIVVGVMASGWIALWHGLPSPEAKVMDVPHAVQVEWIPAPVQVDREDDVPNVMAVHIVPAATPTFLVAYEDDAFFYLISLSSSGYDIKAYGDATSGAVITCLSPYFAKEAEEESFLIAGDSLGTVSIYPLSPSSHAIPVLPTRRLDTSPSTPDPITSVAWNSTIFITGSRTGALNVYDGLTFTHVRTLSYQIPASQRRLHRVDVQDRAVAQIFLGTAQDVVVASVGERVVAYKAGPVPLRGYGTKGGVRGRPNGQLKKKDRNANSKYREKIELSEAIASSKEVLEAENAYKKLVIGREKEQRDRMNEMGLDDEAQALEYAMMMSLEDKSLDIDPAVASASDDRSLTSSSEDDLFGGFDDIPSKSIPGASSIPSAARPRVKTTGNLTGAGEFPTISPTASSSSTSFSSKAWSGSSPSTSFKNNSVWGGQSPNNAWSRTSSPALPESKGKGKVDVTTKTRQEIEDEEMRIAIELSLKDV